jgi:hypothetical protein
VTGDRGSATLPALVLVSLLWVAAAGLADVGRLLAAHVQATAAADAAALAAAPATFFGGDPRREAATWAAANGARLRSCGCPLDRRWAPRTVTVEVAIDVDLLVLGRRLVRARAAAEFDPGALLGG